MPTLTVAAHARPSLILPALLSVAFVRVQDGNSITDIKFSLVENTVINKRGNVVKFAGDHGRSAYDTAVLETVLKHSPHNKLPIGTQFKDWLGSLARLGSIEASEYMPSLRDLDAHLVFNACIIGTSLTLADLAAWGALRDHEDAFRVVQEHFENVHRWYRKVEEGYPWINNIVLYLRAFTQRTARTIKTPPLSPPTDQASLNNVRSTATVVRFCPKFALYTHIGHAKSAILNDHFAHECHRGKLIFRLDDTKPSSRFGQFQAALSQDLKALGILQDKRSYASDYFTEIEEHVVQLIKDGNVYADILDEVLVKTEKGDQSTSKYRNLSAEDNLAWFEEIRRGTYKGAKRCLRARTSVEPGQANPRDPIVYRPWLIPHTRTGTRFKAYPSYELAMAVIDHLEGVTHAILDDESPDRNADYRWLQTAFGFHGCEVIEYPHLNLQRDQSMKRDISRLVSDGSIRSGWDHLRKPALDEMMRRGLLVPALREFCLMRSARGSSEASTWNTLWKVNIRHLEEHAPRFIAIDKAHMVVSEVRNVPCDSTSKSAPTKPTSSTQHILIGQTDASTLRQGERITLSGYCDATVLHKTTRDRGITTPLTLDCKTSSPPPSPTSSTLSRQSSTISQQSSSSLTHSSTTTSSPSPPRRIPTLPIESTLLIPIELFDFSTPDPDSRTLTHATPRTATFPVKLDLCPDDPPPSNYLNLDCSFRSEAIGESGLAGLAEGEMVLLEGKGFFRVDRRWREGESLVLFSVPGGRW